MVQGHRAAGKLCVLLLSLAVPVSFLASASEVFLSSLLLGGGRTRGCVVVRIWVIGLSRAVLFVDFGPLKVGLRSVRISILRPLVVVSSCPGWTANIKSSSLLSVFLF